MSNKSIYSSLFNIGKRVALVALFLFLLRMYYGEKDENLERKNLIEASLYETKFWKNAYGQSVAKVQVLQTKDYNSFLKFKTKDSTILKLQEDVKEHKKKLKKQGSATRFTSEANIELNVETTVDTTGATIIDNYIYPKYISNFNLGGWVMGNSIATKDSTSYNFKYRDEYSVIIGLEKDKLFKKATPYALVKSSNPHNIITSARAYQVTFPPRKFISIAPSLNFGYGFDGRLSATLGVSLQLEKLALKF